MAIDPLQKAPAQPAYHKRGTGATKDGSTFEALMAGMRGESRPGSGEARAVAELLRIEMLRQSLSLSGDKEMRLTSPVTTQRAYLEAIAESCRVGKEKVAIDAPPADVPSGDSVEKAGIGDIEQTAARFLGTPYRFGGEGPAGIDCSSFVQQVFREHRIALPRTAREQNAVGSAVGDGELRKGDLVFFRTYASYPSHVGIYLGEGKMIHASSARGKVVVSDMNTDYYRSRYLGAKRVTA
jgi:cell wall-associated NlpC family hydrolase